MESQTFYEKLIALTQMEFGGNLVHKYLIAIAAFIISFLVVKFISAIGIRHLKKFAKKTKIEWDDFIIHLISKNATWFSLVLSLYIGVSFITLTPKIQRVTLSIFVILITFVVVRMVQGLIRYWFEIKYFKENKDVGKISIMRNMLILFNTLLWAGAVLFILDNLGFDITTVVAGLGIGGVAIALASQNILSDIFSYFTIFFDKPFEVGDFIVVNGKSGTIQHIGIKTTRITSLQGEELVFGNSDLIKSCIQNFKKLQSRRVVQTLGVAYETPQDKLKKIPDIITEVIKNKESIRFDRAHFQSFGDFSLNFEYVYYVDSASYLDFMDIQQKINFELFDSFAKEGIEFAYPTQTLFVNQVSTT